MKKVISKTLGIKHNEDELAVIMWLKSETSRSAGGAYKFAAAKLAKELGYVPKAKK